MTFPTSLGIVQKLVYADCVCSLPVCLVNLLVSSVDDAGGN